MDDDDQADRDTAELPAAFAETPVPIASAPAASVKDHPELAAPLSPHPTPAPATLSNDGTVTVTLPHLFALHPESGEVVADTMQVSLVATRHGRSHVLASATFTGKTETPYTRELPFKMPA